MTHSRTIEEMSRFIETQWLFGSFCPLSSPPSPPTPPPHSPLGRRRVRKKNTNVKYIPKKKDFRELLLLLIVMRRRPLHVHDGKWGRCQERRCCRVPSEWVDKCYMSASCLKTRCMISLSSGPTEITVGRRAARPLVTTNPCKRGAGRDGKL